MNPDSLEGSIQNLLLALYPPFEATAPTVLSQLFQIIDSRYQGDALRCLLDFLVPAKHILDSVQQAACAQYSNVVFLCEGWPLCLRDQVVVHLAPIDPLLLQPGDFYLQVAPFCDQSARIVVCSLLEEEGLRVEVVEETPIPETSYPCIFSSDWLKEINQGRHGTPLSQCLLATEQGVVRLPWEQVVVPEFVDVPQGVGNSMASASSSYSLSSPSLPLPPSLPDFSASPAQTAPSNPLLLPKETASRQSPLTVQDSDSKSSSHPTAFSVETRICPAKHGIAVSLCLVDISTASSSRLVKVNEAEPEPKPIGWVSPNTWDSRCTVTGTCTAANTSTGSGVHTPASISEDTNTSAGTDKSKGVSENIVSGQDKHKDTSTSRPADQVCSISVAEGEYIDILQATMLFGGAQALTQEKQQLQVQMEPHTQIQTQMQHYTHAQAQRQPRAQMQEQTYLQPQAQPSTQIPPQTQSHMHVQSPTKTQTHTHPISGAVASFRPHIPGETGHPSALHNSQPHHPRPDLHEPCIRTVRFSEKPCTPCMKRKEFGKVSRAQELRCRYRESYQAAIQNPVTFEREKERRNMFAVVEEDGDVSQCEERRRPPPADRGDPWFHTQGTFCNPVMQNQPTSPLHGGICKESGEKNTIPCWKPGDANTALCMDYRDTNALNYRGQPEQTIERNTVPFREPRDAHTAKHKLHSVNGENLEAGTRINATKSCGVSSSLNDSKQADLNSTKPCRLPFSSSEISGMNPDIAKPHKGLQNRTDSAGMNLNISKSLGVPQSRRESVLSDGRCSSLSTAVVDTSEKCEVVIVQGQNVRRRERTNSCAEMVPRLHVVKCKNATAFGLVSPKINRRKIVNKDGAQPGSVSTPSRNGHQSENRTEGDPPPATETHKSLQFGSGPPRPDHLPLGSPDPRTHPVHLGLASLTGGRDRTGRAVVELYGEHQGWRSTVTSLELYQMLLYFHSVIRREVREAGMTLVFDARRTLPQPQLYKALMALQEQTPQALNSLVLLVDKETGHRPEKCPGVQSEVVTSMKALYKLVEASQLTSNLEGTLSHSRCDWLELHQKLFPFVSDLHEASSLLLRAISKLEEPQRIDTVQAVQQCMMDQRTLMRDVLEDSRLVSLQREGGAMLARLRKESDLKYPHCEDLSDAVDSVTSLYNHVEEQAHVLVQRSNVSLEHLEYLLRLREMEAHFMQSQEWFDTEGERHLLEAETVEDSSDCIEQTLNSFTAFLIEAIDRQQHTMSLVSEAERLQESGLSYPETERFRAVVCTFKSNLEDFMSRAEACGRELQIMVNVSDFCEQATALARECKDYLDQSQTSTHTTQDQYLDQNTTPSSEVNTQPTQHGPILAPHSQFNVLLPSDHTSILQTYQDRFLQFSPERFQEMKAQASALRSSRGMRVWNVAWLKCQEARQQLQERMQDVDEVYHQQPHTSAWCERHCADEVGANVQTTPPHGQSLVLQSTPGPGHPQWEGIISGAVDIGKRRPILGSSITNSTAVARCDIIVKPDDGDDGRTNKGSKVAPGSPRRSARRIERQTKREMASRGRRERDAAALSQSHTVGCQWFPWRRGLGARSVSEDSCTTTAATPTPVGSSTPPEPRVRPPSSCSHHGQPSCRILQEAQRFQLSRHGSFCSNESCVGEGGAAGGNGVSCSKHSSLPIRRCEGTFCLASPQESASNALRLQRVLEELVFTEREYVRSLGYILTHYHPLLDRPDIPQDLRGKRGVIFGNLEKLYDFHSHNFLPELEACEREPGMVARCFLRHRESFGLYALYSKNKPQSDALILHRRHDIFKRKQQELGDMMDLSSYLLRPIQRISKYSLLLQDMLALAGPYRVKDIVQDTLHASSVCAQSVCGPGVYVPDVTSIEREKAEIQAAADLVRFQMRHGNDLLTMDAIQDCDVNLKEQGQLIRQDEFTVIFRKKKCVRRVFLFEDLILFSKTKKTEIGNDVYVYKQSFKTCDIGMTHNSGVSGLCFEIWFRRRKSEDTYTLKAPSMEVKKAWTTDLERILWDQAAHSRELRLQERVFMGMGRKPFMDIQPSEAAICDRAVNCILPGRIPVACCSHRGLEYPRPHSIGSGSTASTTLSQSSSSSGRGSLPALGYPGNHLQGLEAGHVVCSTPEAVADNELNHHHLQQHHLHRNCEQWKLGHHLLTDSPESSGERSGLFSGSDLSCLSAIGGEVVDSSSSFVSQSSKPRPSLCRMPSLRNGSPAVTRKNPSIASKPQSLAESQVNEIIIGKSTEV